MIEIWIAGIVLFAAAAALVYIYLVVKPVMPYLYLSSMLQARSGKFLDSRKTNRLTESKSLKDFSDKLSSTFYDVDGEDVSKLHTLFDQKYFELIAEIQKLAPKQFTDLLEVYMLTYESAIVKMLYKAKLQKRKVDIHQVYAVGSLNESILIRGASTTDFDEFKALFTGTLYSEVVKNKYDSIAKFEHAVDVLIHTQFREKLAKLKIADKKLIFDLFNVLLDQRNVMATLQRLIREEETLLFDGGFLDNATLQKAQSTEDVIAYLTQTQYGEFMKSAKAKYDKSKSVSHFDIAFERFIRKIIVDVSLEKPQGAFAVFGFILRARMDKQNVQVVSKGIESKMNSQKIAEMVI